MAHQGIGIFVRGKAVAMMLNVHMLGIDEVAYCSFREE